ncbi:suppressor of fused domain protein [Exiguobacterium artemiae]|uniref:suppressor of fused domain protein n=1 Tax=Exiguobacterium artemiae TaxID=340145 RepID=UPI0004791A6F|nr:suppressor of fused domain protein [Exiguobacterium sibiricum]
MNYIEHLEKHCGEIKGSLELEDMMEENIQFLKFENAPIDNTYTATTLGLLWRPLQFEEERFYHQELMMSVKQPEAEEDVIELLWRLTTHALETGQTFELGEFYSMPKTVFGQYGFAGVYVTAPFYFDESFFIHRGDTEFDEPEHVLPVWFVPIFESEADYLEQHGVDAFDEIIDATEGELLDLTRQPLI